MSPLIEINGRPTILQAAKFGSAESVCLCVGVGRVGENLVQKMSSELVRDRKLAFLFFSHSYILDIHKKVMRFAYLFSSMSKD